MPVEISYDGAYQRRGGSKGGVHSRYCFASAISTESWKVLDFEVAYNSCRQCTEKQQALKENRISRYQYVECYNAHEINCQSREYGDVSSVALESRLAPVIFERSVEKNLVYSRVIADGDDKSISILKDKNVYSKYNIDITRQECLSHVQKRIRGHLIEKQKMYVDRKKIDKSNALAKCKTDSKRKTIKDKYKSKTQRNLKHDQDVWNCDAVIIEINLLSDGMIDKITSLYGLVIKDNRDKPTFDIKNALIGIVNHLSANERNCDVMCEFCKRGVDSWCN